MGEKATITVTGDSKQVDLLIRENKVRISRGLLEFKKASPGETSKKAYTDKGQPEA